MAAVRVAVAAFIMVLLVCKVVVVVAQVDIPVQAAMAHRPQVVPLHPWAPVVCLVVVVLAVDPATTIPLPMVTITLVALVVAV
jgi:hypothetical protein